jgi:DegV family protein with EDD domain
MSKIAIITDSTAYIPSDLLRKYNIHVVPQVLIWGNETFDDGIDIKPYEFYARLEKSKEMPSTAQVTPQSFSKIFKQLLDQDYQIAAILLPPSLSGTVESAQKACEDFLDAPIVIIESNSTSMAMGLQVLAAARVAENGANLEEVKGIVNKAREQTGVVFAVNTLEFLHRGGRIGGASRYLGTALNIKPILEITGGKVQAIERVRTRKKSLLRLVEIVEERVKDKHPVRLAVLHARAEEEARELQKKAESRIENEESIFSEVSPVIGTHAGPGTIGLAYMFGI